jgi:hypothetical protein
VLPDSSAAQRSKATGALVLTMPLERGGGGGGGGAGGGAGGGGAGGGAACVGWVRVWRAAARRALARGPSQRGGREGVVPAVQVPLRARASPAHPPHPRHRADRPKQRPGCVKGGGGAEELRRAVVVRADGGGGGDDDPDDLPDL